MTLDQISYLVLWLVIISLLVIGLILCFRKEEIKSQIILPPLPVVPPPAMTYEKVIQHYSNKKNNNDEQ